MEIFTFLFMGGTLERIDVRPIGASSKEEVRGGGTRAARAE